MWVAPLDVILDRERALIVQPDLFFISHERAFIVQDRIDGAPDLVIEVLSPHPRIGQTDERVQWFMGHGVRECWLVEQNRPSITVIEFADRLIAARQVFERREPIRSTVLSDFTASLDDVLD
jgi:Uma2 family endonuclease